MRMAEVGSPPVFADFLNNTGHFNREWDAPRSHLLRTKQVCSYSGELAAEGIPSPAGQIRRCAVHGRRANAQG